MRVIDVSQIDGNIRKVIDRYAAAPNITVPQTFRQALTRRATIPRIGYIRKPTRLE
jgi:hypothetical protein